jgi:hypothetical protein
MNIITADRVAAQISIEYREKTAKSQVSFLGTQFDNLRIAGKPIEILLATDLPQLSDANEFGDRFQSPGPPPPNFKGPQFAEPGRRGHSPVMDAKGNVPGSRIAANTIEIPQFGVLFLADLVFISDMLDLTMIRFQGEPPGHGSIEIAFAMCSVYLIKSIE